MKPLIIKCARCNRAVDRVDLTEAPEAYGWRIVVQCHGAHDEMLVSQADVERLRHGDELLDATAFRPEARITAGDHLRSNAGVAP